jgi:hypothetical protein
MLDGDDRKAQDPEVPRPNLGNVLERARSGEPAGGTPT